MDNTTAKVTCFARAYHFENNNTHIFADSMAARLLGDDYDHIAESMIEGISFFLPGFEGTQEFYYRCHHRKRADGKPCDFAPKLNQDKFNSEVEDVIRYMVREGRASVSTCLPKSEDSRSPKTPKEIEEAIMEAFKHFQMI